MEFKYKIYAVTDIVGKQCAVVANDSGDIVQICGLLDTDLNSTYFESEAYHLDTWCTENGLLLKIIDMTTKV